MPNKYGVHEIILNNKIHEEHWFDSNGNYVSAFIGLDHHLYHAVVPPKDWLPETWELYMKEVVQPKAAANPGPEKEGKVIKFKKKSS